MRIYFDKYKQPEQPKVYLAAPNKQIICPLNSIDEESFELELNVNNTHEISFDVNRYITIEENGENKQIESNGYSFLSVLLRIYVEGIGWFIMKPPSTNSEGFKEYKSINASSAEIEMQQHDLKGLKINTGTTDSYEMLVEGNVDIVGDVEFAKEQIKFYNPENPELSFLDILLKVSNMHGWTIGYIDDIPKKYRNYVDGEYQEKEVRLSDEIGTFDIDAQDLYSFLTQDAAKFFSCIFVFDSLSFTINAYRPEHLGKNTNINISFRNIKNSNEVSINEDIYTRYYVQGGDDLGIEYVNYGTPYLENLFPFKNEKYMSKELIKKYTFWENDYEGNRLTYIENTRLYNKQQSVISELYNRVPLDDCSTDWSTFPDDKLLEAQANYQAQLKGYESFYVDEEGNFDEEALQASPDANDYYQIKDVILPSIEIELDNRDLPPEAEEEEYIDTYKTDWKLYGLDELSVNLEIYKNNKKLAEEADCTEPYDPETSTQTEDYHNKMYEIYSKAVEQLDPDFVGSCQEAYNQRKSEIEEAEAIQKQYDDIRKECAKSVTKETWKHTDDDIEYSFTEKDLKDLSKLYIDADYVNDNMFIVDSDDAVTMIDEQLKLMDAAIEDLYSASREQYIYSTSIENFLALYNYKDYTNNLDLGDFIYLEVKDDYIVKLRVVSISYNPLKMDNNITITFSNMIQSKSSRDDFVYLLDSSNNRGKNIASGNNNSFVQNDGAGLTSGLIQKLLASGALIDKINQIINNGSVIVPGGSMSLTELNTKMMKVLDLFAENGFFEYLQAKLIVVDKIVAESGEFKDLSALVAMIDNLIAGNISAELGHIINLTAENVNIDEAVIRDLIAANITVSMLKAGDISADSFHIVSDDGGLEIAGNTMQFKDANGVVRIQIGRDANNEFTFCLYDETGKGVLIDSTGIKESAIKDGLIVNDMIKPGTIGKDRLGFNIVETDENGNVDWGNITANGHGLDIEFGSIKENITEIENELQSISGQNPIVVQLDNEMVLFNCDKDGLVVDNELIEIHYSVYEKTEKVPATAQIALLPSGVTIGKNEPSTETNDGIIILNIAQGADLGNADSGAINIKFIYEDKETTKNFLWLKSKGAQGEAARVFTLESDVSTVIKDDSEKFTPSSITFSSFYRDGKDIVRNEYNGRFVIEESTNGVVFDNKYLSETDENTHTYTIANPDTKIIRCSLYASGGVTQLLDIKTVSVLSDISQETIENINKQISGVSQKVDAVEKSITDKVWQSDIDTKINNYDGSTVKTIRDQVAEQKTEIGKISSSVSDVESKLETKADGSIVQSLSEKVSNAIQDAEGFKQTVKDTYATKDEVESVESTFTQKAGEIEQRVENNEGDVSQLKVNVNGLSGKVSDAEGNITILQQTSEKLETRVENAEGSITELETTAEGLQVEVSKKQDSSLVSIRYIRDWLNGNSVDDTNYFVECKVFNGETNIAEGIIPTLKDQLGNPVSQPENIAIYTDGDHEIETDDGEFIYIDGGTGLKYIELDLGTSISNIDSIQVWHYFVDNRNYNHKLEVSDDGENWTTLFDSSVQKNYNEKRDGRSYYISESLISSQFAKFNVGFDEINAKVSDANDIIADLKLTTEGFETSISNHEEELQDFQDNITGMVDGMITEEQLDTKLSVELGKITNLVQETKNDLTKLSEVVQNSDGWKALFAQIGMYDMPDVVTSVLLSALGITVTNELTGTKTKMTTEGFSGWYNPTPQDGTDGTRVFALDKDVAITSRLYVDNGIDCNTMKIIPQKYGNKGAIVFVKTGGSS